MRRGPVEAVEDPTELPVDTLAVVLLWARLSAGGGGLLSWGGGGGEDAMLDAASRAARSAPREVATAAGGGDSFAAPARSRWALGDRGAFVRLESTRALSHGCCTAAANVARSASSTVSKDAMKAFASSDTRGVGGKANAPAAMRWYVLAVRGSAAWMAKVGGGVGLLGEELSAMVGALSGSKGGNPYSNS